MNLPASAYQFLDVFRGCYAGQNITVPDRFPKIHCYTFALAGDEEERRQQAKEKIEGVLGATLTDEDELTLHNVRNVAPNKDMFCVSFRLPRAVALGEVGVGSKRRASNDAAESSEGVKRAKVGEDGRSMSRGAQ
eukprot:GABV01002062.1.p1 GENE.GABV01002062.1~~GABV01002062.1.p1  ORF type:complete len:135 (-),score=27.90 GABV01002062.1:22-426(-)